MIKLGLFKNYKIGLIFRCPSIHLYINYIKVSRRKYHLIISIDAEKAFNKILHSFMRETNETKNKKELP